MRRLVPLVTCLAVAVLVLTGCGSAASAPIRGDVAAVVAGQDIPVGLVQDRLRTQAPTLRTLLAQQAEQQGTPPAPLDAATLAAQSRSLLTTSVLHVLVAQESARQNINVSPALIDGTLAQVGGVDRLASRTGFDAATLRQLVGDQLATAEIGRRAYDRLSVTLDYATVADRAGADAVARRLEAGEDPGRVFGALPAGSAGTDLMLRPGSAAEGSGSAVSILFGLPANTVTVTSASRAQQGAAAGQDPGAGPWLVVHVRDRALNAPPPGPGVTPASEVDPNSMIDFGLRMLQPTPEAQGVRVNPRFGVWDPTQVEVTAPGGAGTTTPVRAPAP